MNKNGLEETVILKYGFIFMKRQTILKKTWLRLLLCAGWGLSWNGLCKVYLATSFQFSNTTTGEYKSLSQHLHRRVAVAHRTTYLSVSQQQRCTHGRSNGRREVGRAGGSAPLPASCDGAPLSPASAAYIPTRIDHPEPEQNPHAGAQYPSCQCWSPVWCDSLAVMTTVGRQVTYSRLQPPTSLSFLQSQKVPEQKSLVHREWCWKRKHC